MTTLAQDLRYAWRTFANTPAFTVAAVLTLALGVGANASIFSVVSALLLRPLPYADPDRLVILWNRSPGLGISEDWFSTAQYFDIRNGHRGFEQVAIAIGGNVNLTSDGEPQRIGAIRASSNLLPMLGARAEAGRLHAGEDDVPGAPGTAVLGHGTWVRRYGGDPAAVGRTILLNGQSYRIVGVLPASFRLPREVMPTLNGAEDADVVLPLPLAPEAAQVRGREDYNIVGKLKRGVTPAAAQAEMDGLTARLRAEHPDVYPPNGGLTFGVVPLLEQVVGGVRRSLVVLAVAVGFVLLIACSNIASLLLSRALGRQKEFGIRAALGASGSRLVRQLLTESLVLAVAGGVVGLVLSAASLRAIHAFGAKSVPRLAEIAVDGRVLLFTLGLSIASGLLFGLAPALGARRLDLGGVLADASRSASASGLMWGRGQNVRRLFVVAELALSVVLLICAGLLVQSFAKLQAVKPGFNPSGTLTLELTLSGRKYTDAAVMLETWKRLWENLSAIPGVTAAGGVSALPLSQMMSWGPITVEGRIPPPGEKFVNVDQRMVAADYFRTMEIPLLSGRLFNALDTRANPRVAIVDDRMAQQLWPGQDSVGKRLKTGGIDSTAPWITVVGVAGRITQDSLDAESRIAMYFPHTQQTTRAMNVVVRSGADPATLAQAVRATIAGIDPDLPLYGVRTMDQRVRESLAQRRFSTLLLSLFALIAFGLAAVGIYGVIACLVAQGTRELGIRMALGATPRDILMLVLSQGFAVTAAGVGVGVIAAVVLTRFMRTLLFGVSATDPLTFAAVPLLLAAVALLATGLPARRATRIDPIESLRSE